MSAPLSPTQAKVYARATVDWREVPKRIDAGILVTLRARGAVEIRFRPVNERGYLTVVEWRRTPRGAAA